MRMRSVWIDGELQSRLTEDKNAYTNNGFVAQCWELDDQKASYGEKLLFPWVVSAIADGEEMRSMRIDVKSHYVDITLPPSLVKARVSRTIWFAPDDSGVYVRANLWYPSSFSFGRWELKVEDASSIPGGAVQGELAWDAFDPAARLFGKGKTERHNVLSLFDHKVLVEKELVKHLLVNQDGCILGLQGEVLGADRVIYDSWILDSKDPDDLPTVEGFSPRPYRADEQGKIIQLL